MATKPLRADSARNNPTLQSPNLRIAISSALRRHDISPSRFGRDAVGDPAFVLRLRTLDRTPRPRTVAKVRAYIDGLEAIHA